jgi:hypothetical protein
MTKTRMARFLEAPRWAARETLGAGGLGQAFGERKDIEFENHYQ